MELAKVACYYAFKQSAPHTNLVGVNRVPLLKMNLDVLFNGLSENEVQVLEYLQEK